MLLTAYQFDWNAPIRKRTIRDHIADVNKMVIVCKVEQTSLYKIKALDKETTGILDSILELLRYDFKYYKRLSTIFCANTS